jgi:small subunit ribosomal protein S1
MPKKEKVTSKVTTEKKTVKKATPNVAKKAASDAVKKATKPSKEMTMEELLAAHEDAVKPLAENDIIEGTVVAVTKAGIWLDLGPHGTGLAVGADAAEAGYKDSLPGDKITASVLMSEMEEGYALLSLKKASREKNWSMLADVRDRGELVKVKPFDANKGGLLIEFEGIKGFMPVSQLSTEHYPRVADKEEILNRLNDLVGQELEVSILDVDQKEGKLIFSEKEARKGEMSEAIEGLEIGQTVKGKVTGVVDFGIFMNIDGIEGLVHISEISWDRVEDPKKYAKVGDNIDVVVIGKDQDKISLSLKRLQPDPWAKEITDIKVGAEIEGEVTRITPFGAFVRVTKSVEALVHISELSNDHIANPSEVVEVGKTYKFKVVSVDVTSHKLALSLKAVAQKSEKGKAISDKKSEKSEPSEGEAKSRTPRGAAANATKKTSVSAKTKSDVAKDKPSKKDE